MLRKRKTSLHTFDALLVRSATKVTEELFKKMTSLKIVARAGVGVDNIDIDEATKHGVIVVNAPNGNTISTAEHTFAMFSALMRHIPQANISVKSREWNRSAYVGSEPLRKNARHHRNGPHRKRNREPRKSIRYDRSCI